MEAVAALPPSGGMRCHGGGCRSRGEVPRGASRRDEGGLDPHLSSPSLICQLASLRLLTSFGGSKERTAAWSRDAYSAFFVCDPDQVHAFSTI